MIVAKEKMVSLVYELRVNGPEGEIVESLDASNPLSFIYGSGRLLPKFEENLDGLTNEDKFEFELAPEFAYGEINQDAIVNVPLSAFEIDGKIDEQMVFVGARIPMQDGGGNKLTGTVKSITNDNVEMDFNHPMAGNKLHFKGEVVGVREATEAELTDNCGGCGSSCGCHDEPEMEEAQSGCGCGSGGCC